MQQDEKKSFSVKLLSKGIIVLLRAEKRGEKWQETGGEDNQPGAEHFLFQDKTLQFQF